MSLITRREDRANALSIDERCIEWARQLIDLYGDDAPMKFLWHYCGWVTSVAQDPEAAAERERYLKERVGDPDLSPVEGVYLVAHEIAGRYEDSAFLDELPRRMGIWQEMKALEATADAVEPPSADQPGLEG